jgi:hypothetical protein
MWKTNHYTKKKLKPTDISSFVRPQTNKITTMENKVKQYISTISERNKIREELNTIEKYKDFLAELITQTAEGAKTKGEDKETLTQLVHDLVSQTRRKNDNGINNPSKDQTLPSNIQKFSGRKTDECALVRVVVCFSTFSAHFLWIILLPTSFVFSWSGVASNAFSRFFC